MISIKTALKKGFRFVVVLIQSSKRLLDFVCKLCDRSLIQGPLEIWSPDIRFIEVDCENMRIAQYLIRHGFTRYLGLVREDKKLMELEDEQIGNMSNYFFDYVSPNQIFKNNSEVLILSGSAVRCLWDFSHYRHANHVVWSTGWHFDQLVGFTGWLRHIFVGNIKLHCILEHCDITGKKHFLVVNEISKRNIYGEARRYLSPRLGIDKFLEYLGDRSVRYVVLRWFENMPVIEEGEDIDLLVHDDDVKILDEFFAQQPGLIPCDLYSVSGLPGTQYQDMAYYPPYLAIQILEQAVRHDNCCMVPCVEHYFLSLAYHSLYHKGERSGLQSKTTGVEVETQPEHDYHNVLFQLAQRLSIKVGITLEDLDEYLNMQGWRPPQDTLAKLAIKNQWIEKRFFSVSPPEMVHRYKGLVTFVLRERAIEIGLHNEMRALLENSGFEIIANRSLNSDEKEYCAQRIRGGNWGKGPFPQSGGKPAMAIVAIDKSPVDPSPEILKTHPRLTNEKIMTIKQHVRNLANSRLNNKSKCNVIHSSDNEEHALEYIQILIPEGANNIYQYVEERNTSTKARRE